MMNDDFYDDSEYNDQPILRTGVFRNAVKNVPQRILRMEAMYDPGLSTAEDKRRNFFVQGKYMENFELEYDGKCTFQRWFPTYHDMREDQLMAYFGWRTKVRRGEYEKIDEAYVYVYLYELLNLLGVSSVMDGYEKLEEFREKYILIYQCRELLAYIDGWIKQYCICYGIPPSITGKYYDEEILQDMALGALYHEESTKEAVYKGMCLLSNYKLESSAVFKKYPEEGKELLCRIWKRLNSLIWMKNGGNLFEYLFGRKDRYTLRFFSNAVYFDRMHEDRRYAIDPERVYTFSKGKWYCECFRASDMKNRELSDILREADRQMRQFFDTGHLIKQKEVDGKVIITIQNVLEEYRKEKEEASRPKIELRLERLSGIRKDAAITREKLLTEDEILEEETEVIEEVKEERKELPYGLTKEEAEFLRMLHEGEDYISYLREKRMMVSVVSESINEKLYDVLGDSLLLFDGDVPELQEDYLEDLEELF